nr:hypothetical protein [candidate division Zixibacteria bacterium]
MKIKHIIFTLAVLISLSSLAVALPPGMTAKPAGPGSAMGVDTRTMIDVNNLQMFVTNQGGYAEDWSLLLETAKNDGLYFPAGTDKTVLFSAGIWVGGLVDGDIRLAVGAFDTPEYIQGPMDITGHAQADQTRYKVYKINGDSSVWLNPNKTGLNTNDGIPYTRLDSTLHFNDYTEWQDPDVIADGAPIDTLTDLPLLIGDQMLWTVFNDDAVNDGGLHMYNAYGGGTEPLGVELQASFFGFDLPGALGNTIFAKWIIINKGDNLIESTFVSLWADPDLGGASDDFVGCDTTLSLGYCYNATNNDNAYGATPPAVGFDFLQGPLVPSVGDTAILNDSTVYPDMKILGMSSFNKYINGTDPDIPQQSYDYMKGLDAVETGGPYIDPETGDTTTYFGAGDPVAGTGWVDSNPADRRFMLSTGPFTFNPGDTQVVVAAILVGQGKDRISSVAALKFYDILAQYAYDVNFNIPQPPSRPIVTAQAYNREVTLTWTNRSEVEYDEPTHEFEGYVVYQGETSVGPWTVIKTFDIKNGYGMLKDFVLNADLGDVIYQPVVYGLDEGKGYGLEITEDFINGGRLHNGKTYYYAVTAYSYDYTDWQDYESDPAKPDDEFIIPKGLWFLENRIQAIEITPQDDNPGSDWGSALAPVVQERYDSLLSPSSDVIQPIIIDPNKVNGHTYQVRFRPLYDDTLVDTTMIPWDTTIVPYDTLGYQDGEWVRIYQFWELWDLTTDNRLLKRQFNKSGDENYEIFDGIQFKVIGAHEPGFQGVYYDNDNTAHSKALSGVNWGGAFFDGGCDFGYYFWGGYLDPETMIDSFTTVEVRFTDDIPITRDPSGQRAYNYCRGCDPNYGYQGYFQVPFIAWDVINDYQVNAAFVEMAGSSVYDSTWDPSFEDNGSREYLFPLKSAYDGDNESDAGTGDIDYTTEDFYDGSNFDFLYGAWIQLSAASSVIDSGDVLRFQWANPADANDIYTISTTEAVTGNVALGKSAMDNVRVVPNPYYAYSAYERDQFDRQVRFLGVPEDFTIRIFNLAGDKVRTMESDDLQIKQPGQSWAIWDLATDQGLPVAAGIYIWYLEAPGIGSTYGKMAVFPEVEQLNTY